MSRASDITKVAKRRKSSSLSKKRQSFEKQSDSLTEETNLSTHDDSIMVILSDVPPKINYQDELVSIFFNNMLDVIVDEWITIPDEIPLLCFCKTDKEVEENISKDFKDVTQDDLLSLEVANVEEKQDSLSKKRHSKSIDQVIRSKTVIKRASKDLPTEKRSSTNSATETSPLSSIHSTDQIENTLVIENVIIKFKNGSRYEGPICNKLMNGYGSFFWADGAIYEGEFTDGDATGKGRLQYPDLTIYSGYFCKSFLHGEGVLNINNTSMIYSGNWKAGQKHGKGWLLYQPGSWYEGQWYEDRRHGVGFRQYLTGERYKGQWSEGKMQGPGTFIWANNDAYKGEWLKGFMHGYGEYTWNAFLNETFTFPLENTYRGTWVNGMRDGVGVMTFGIDGGAKLVGMWECNKKHGAGIVVCGNGVLVEKNPLFWEDKPIHLETEQSQTQTELSSNSIQLHDPLKSTSVESNNMQKSSLHLVNKESSGKCLASACSCEILECRMCHMKEKVESLSQVIKDVVKKRPEFLGKRPESRSLYIPIHLPSESIDISYHTNLAIEKYTAQLYKHEIATVFDKDAKDDNMQVCGGIKISEGFPSAIYKYSKWNFLAHANYQSKSKLLPYSKNNVTQSNSEIESRIASYQELQSQIEEKYLRKTITTQLSQMHKIYNRYATIASPHPVTFKPILIRFFLWQMLRDFNILNQKYSLIDMDMILINNPGSGMESEHYPFEKIYFWQFLQILLTLAWTLHSPNDVTDECKQLGILSTIFIKFLNDVVYKNLITTSACSIFEYRDVIPITSVYALYQKLGEPHTARKFLCNVCTKKREEPPCYLKLFNDEKISKSMKGINVVPFGGNIAFLPDDPPAIGEIPDISEEEPVTKNDPYRKELYALRSLKPKKVVECLISVCPQIASDGVLVNMDYPLSFIEFYEALLTCAFMIVDKVKKHEEKIRLREEMERLKELLAMEESSLQLLNKGSKTSKELKKGRAKR